MKLSPKTTWIGQAVASLVATVVQISTCIFVNTWPTHMGISLCFSVRGERIFPHTNKLWKQVFPSGQCVLCHGHIIEHAYGQLTHLVWRQEWNYISWFFDVDTQWVFFLNASCRASNCWSIYKMIGHCKTWVKIKWSTLITCYRFSCYLKWKNRNPQNWSGFYLKNIYFF